MSLYDDIYNDYPLRCAEVWRELNDAAKAKKRDVTLMLMCAAGGFASPWEHFKIKDGASQDQSRHPAFHKYDKAKYKRSLGEMNCVLDVAVSESSLFKDLHFDKCFYAHAKNMNDVRDLVESHQSSGPALSVQPARQIVKLLRNAIAHNNIFAFSGQKSKEISDLGFFGEVVDRKAKEKKVDYYEVIAMPAEDFHTFLTSWFELLQKASPKGNHLKLIVTNALEIDDEPIPAYG